MDLKDQLGRSLWFDKPFGRIISLVPSQTELLVDLGLKEQIVGLTKFCVHPPQLRNEKTIVGGTKEMHFDKIVALSPDIILCNKEENTKEMVEKLEKDFVVHVSDVSTLDDNYELIRQYGKLFNRQEKAEEINKRIQSEAAGFQNFLADKAGLRVAYFIWREPWMLAGGQTFIHHLLELNKFENVYSEFQRYPEVRLKQLKTADFYLLSSEPFPFTEKHKAEIQAHWPDAKFAFVDGEFFSWYGSRLEKAFGYFRLLREQMSI